MSVRVGEWAGIPLPIEDENLIIEPSYQFAQALKMRKDDDEDVGEAVLRNTFWSTRHRRDIVIWQEHKDGPVLWAGVPGVGNIDQQMRTMGCSIAWGVEQEAKALQTLATLLKHHPFKTYLLAGAFLETSERSGLTYLFRKLRPTVVLSTRGDHVRPLCALCMHPIGYYENSWAGAMTPTDDVIAHLMLMRGDEPMLWRRSSQHNPHRPEAGI